MEGISIAKASAIMRTTCEADFIVQVLNALHIVGISGCDVVLLLNRRRSSFRPERWK
jgi:hypothetical protein